MDEKTFVFAGVGGQGVMTSGTIFSNIAAQSGKNIIYLPSYGAEMRGGAASSTVKVSSNRIPNIMVEEVDCLTALTESAYTRYESYVSKNGIILLNEDMISDKIKLRDDVKIIKVPCTSIAAKLGMPKIGNIVMLGVLLKIVNIVDIDSAISYMSKYFKDQNKEKFIEINANALKEGYNAISWEE